MVGRREAERIAGHEKEGLPEEEALEDRVVSEAEEEKGVVGGTKVKQTHIDLCSLQSELMKIVSPFVTTLVNKECVLGRERFFFATKHNEQSEKGRWNFFREIKLAKRFKSC